MQPKTDEIEYLEKKVEQKPKSMFFARLADYYLQKDNVEKAMELCQNGVQDHPNYASGYFVLAKCYIAMQQYEEAERRLKKVLTVEPGFLQAHKLYADLLEKQGWQKSSQTAYKRIKEIDPLEKIDIPDQKESANQFFEETADKEGADVDMQPDIDKDYQDNAELPTDLETDFPIEDWEEPKLDIGTDKNSQQDLDEEPTVEPQDAKEEKQKPDLDEDLLSGLEDTSDFDYESDDFEKEEARFSDILDDIFSPGMDQEEKGQIQDREVIENAAKDQDFNTEQSEPSSDSIPAEDTTPPAEPENPPAQQEDQQEILDDIDDEERASLQNLVNDEEQEEDEIHFEDEFSPFDQEKSAVKDIDDTFEAPLTEEEAKDTPDDSGLDDQEEDFSEFLSSLNEDEDIEEPESKSNDFREEIEKTESDKDNIEPGTEPEQEEIEQTNKPSKDIDDTVSPKEKFVTPTLGEIYAAQGQYEKAIDVFEMLAKKHPENEWYQTKLEYLNKKLEEQKDSE